MCISGETYGNRDCVPRCTSFLLSNALLDLKRVDKWDKCLKYRRNNHFQESPRTYLFKYCDLPQEDEGLKTKLVAIWKGLGFVDEDIPSDDEAMKKQCRIIMIQQTMQPSSLQDHAFLICTKS